MSSAPVFGADVRQAVPFWGVTNMETSLRFYADGLGFKMKHWWIPDRVEDKPDGRIRWCWLSAARLPSCYRSFCQDSGPLRRLELEYMFFSCVKTP